MSIGRNTLAWTQLSYYLPWTSSRYLHLDLPYISVQRHNYGTFAQNLRDCMNLEILKTIRYVDIIEVPRLEEGISLKQSVLRGCFNFETLLDLDELDVSYCCLFDNSLDFSNPFCSGEIWVGPWHMHCGYVEIAKGVNDCGAKRWLWGTRTMNVVVTRNAIWRGKCNVFFHMLKVSHHNNNRLIV